MKNEALILEKCKPCEGFEQPLEKTVAVGLLARIKGWQLTNDGSSISHDYVMSNFQTAVNLVNRIADLAESENHHPDIHLTDYKKLRVDLSTHAIGGLSLNDFILAAKINKIMSE